MIVAYDVKRLADAHRFSLQNFGVTVYARELFDRLATALGPDLRPVVHAVGENDLPSLELAIETVEHSTRRSVATDWRRPRPAAARWALRQLQRVPRGRRFAAPIERRVERWSFGRRPFEGVAAWDVYHSPIDALPPRSATGRAARVLTVHDVIYLKFPEWASDGGAATRRIVDSIDPDRDWVICDSESTLRDLQQLRGVRADRAAVVHLAPSAAFDAPRAASAAPLLQSLGLAPSSYVLALGQRDPRKNLPRLMDAFARVSDRPEFANIVLLVATSRRDEDHFTSELVGRNLAPSRFRVIADVDDAVLAGLYASARCFAYVSLYEGFGIPLLEAMRAECCVLASNVSSIPEVAGDAAHYVDPTSVDAIASGLARMLQDEPLRDLLRATGKQRAAGFTWEKTARETSALYERVAESVPRQAAR